ncbi:MAG TPA: hypothetical protein ENK19_05640 [Acidobacteria bacterium]|nr:hypothetical protein [Acidobacteriota bacterium]
MTGGTRLIDRLAGLELVLVTGKGGVGKTTVTAALGQLLAAAGRTVLLMETDPRESLHRLLDLPPSGGEIVRAGNRLFLQNLQPRRVLDDLVTERVRLGPIARRVLASPVYQHFAEGAPGLKETALLGRALRLVEGHGPRVLRRPDVVLLDAPATGHGVALLQAPSLVADVITSGPVGRMAGDIARFVTDAGRTGVVTVTAAEEMPVSETLELIAALDATLGRRPELVVVNGLYPPAPQPAGARPDPLELLRRRHAINQAQLERLGTGWDGPTTLLPLLPIDRGPALAGSLARRLRPILEEVPR